MKQERIQDLRAFETRLFQAVQEALEENDNKLGVAINPRTLDCKACTKEQAQSNAMEWRDTDALECDGKADYDAVADVAAEYCFVR